MYAETHKHHKQTENPPLNKLLCLFC